MRFCVSAFSSGLLKPRPARVKGCLDFPHYDSYIRHNDACCTIMTGPERRRAATPRRKRLPAQSAPGAATINEAPALLVFVSFSMPDATLVRLVDQAARARATLVLRGLVDGSLQKTVLRAQALIGQRKVGFQIDPQAFDRFSISATPTFVLLRAGAVAAPCAAGTCFPASSFVAAAGDVSIDYALEYFRRAAPSFSRDAGVVLATLKKVGP